MLHLRSGPWSHLCVSMPESTPLRGPRCPGTAHHLPLTIRMLQPRAPRHNEGNLIEFQGGLAHRLGGPAGHGERLTQERAFDHPAILPAFVACTTSRESTGSSDCNCTEWMRGLQELTRAGYAALLGQSALNKSQPFESKYCSASVHGQRFDVLEEVPEILLRGPTFRGTAANRLPDSRFRHRTSPRSTVQRSSNVPLKSIALR